MVLGITRYFAPLSQPPCKRPGNTGNATGSKYYLLDRYLDFFGEGCEPGKILTSQLEPKVSLKGAGRATARATGSS